MEKKKRNDKGRNYPWMLRILLIIFIVILILLLLRSCLNDETSPNNGSDGDIYGDVVPGYVDYILDTLPELDIKYSPWKGIYFEIRGESGYEYVVIYYVNWYRFQIQNYFDVYDGVLVLPTTFQGHPITKIDEMTFQGRHLPLINLTRMTYLEVIGYRAFANNQTLKTLNLNGLHNLRIIGKRAFQQARTTTLLLNELNALEEIGAMAFMNNYLLTVYLEDMPNLKIIGEQAFADQVVTPLEGEFRHVRLNNLPQLIYVGSRAFSGAGSADVGNVREPSQLANNAFSDYMPGGRPIWHT